MMAKEKRKRGRTKRMELMKIEIEKKLIRMMEEYCLAETMGALRRIGIEMVEEHAVFAAAAEMVKMIVVENLIVDCLWFPGLIEIVFEDALNGEWTMQKKKKKRI